MAPKKKKDYAFPGPMENSSLVGHGATQSAFIEAWKNRAEYPIHPVWMLSGVRGIGKATLAYRIARFVFKNDADNNSNSLDLFGGDDPAPATLSMDMDPDDPIFQKMINGGFGDLFIIDMARNIDKDGKSKTDGKIISVYTVRNMIERMQMSSMEGGWRVIIIDSVDELNTAASNAMLKLLEEPPANTLFILVVHQLSNVLPTIRSRARVEKLHPLTTDQLRTLCAQLIPDANDVSPALLRLANGSFGRIAGLKKSGGDELYEELLSICNDRSANSADILSLAGSIAKEPDSYGILLDAVSHFGCADLYPIVTMELAKIKRIYLEPEVALFKIITDIRKALGTGK